MRDAILEPGDFPAPAIGSTDESVCFLDVGERQLGGVPIQRGVGEPAGDASEKNRLGQGTGVVEGGGGFAFATDGVDEFLPVVPAFDHFHFEVTELGFRQEGREGDVGDHHDAVGAEENGTLVGEGMFAEEQADGLGRPLISVIPRDGNGAGNGVRRGGEHVANDGVDRPGMIVGGGPLAADGDRRRQGECLEDGIEDVAAHVAEGASPEVGPLAPVSGVIPAVADEGALFADADPEVPVEPGRDGVLTFGHGTVIAPILAAPCVDFMDLADAAFLDEAHGRSVFPVRMDLDAHLGHAFLLARNFGQPPGLVYIVGQGFLAVHVEAAIQRRHADGAVHVVGRGDVHRIEFLLLVEQLPVVLVDPGFRESLLEIGDAVHVDVADGDHGHGGVGGDGGGVGEGHAGGAEAGVAHPAGGRCGEKIPGDEGRGQGRRTAKLEKPTSGGGRKAIHGGEGERIVVGAQMPTRRYGRRSKRNDLLGRKRTRVTETRLAREGRLNYRRGMDTELRDRVILVTGASGGIGSATARAFAAEGGRVVLHANKGREQATKLAAELTPSETFVVTGDLRREAVVKRVFAAALKRFGRIDVLVANAGSWETRDVGLKDMSMAQWRSTQDAVLTSAFLCLREFFRCVEKQRRGNAILIGSTAAIFGEAGHADYAAAKAAMAFGLTRTLKNEIARLAPRTRDYCGGRVNCVCPGWTVVPRNATKLADARTVRRVTATMALPKVGRPEDVANSVVFLASDRLAGHLSGQTLLVAGGMEGRWLWQPEEIDPDLA